jgi:hypothetical protein
VEQDNCGKLCRNGLAIFHNFGSAVEYGVIPCKFQNFAIKVLYTLRLVFSSSSFAMHCVREVSMELATVNDMIVFDSIYARCEGRKTKTLLLLGALRRILDKT